MLLLMIEKMMVVTITTAYGTSWPDDVAQNDKEDDETITTGPDESPGIATAQGFVGSNPFAPPYAATFSKL